MFGRPTPTKQTCCPASSRAAATIIISALENGSAVIGRSLVRPASSRDVARPPLARSVLGAHKFVSVVRSAHGIDLLAGLGVMFARSAPIAQASRAGVATGRPPHR